MQQFRGGLEFKAHRLLYLSTLGLRVIKKREEKKMLSLTVSRQGGCFFILKRPKITFRDQDPVNCARPVPEREFLIDNPVVRIYFMTVMIRWTGFAPWECEFPFPGSLTSTFLVARPSC